MGRDIEMTHMHGSFFGLCVVCNYNTNYLSCYQVLKDSHGMLLFIIIVIVVVFCQIKNIIWNVKYFLIKSQWLNKYNIVFKL